MYASSGVARHQHFDNFYEKIMSRHQHFDFYVF